jgi:hypothetical protein
MRKIYVCMYVYHDIILISERKRNVNYIYIRLLQKSTFDEIVIPLHVKQTHLKTNRESMEIVIAQIYRIQRSNTIYLLFQFI